MIEKLPELVNRQPRLVHRGRFVNETFMVEVGDVQYLVTVADGVVAKVEAGPFVMRSWRFAIRATRDIWERFWQPMPAPGYHDLFALLRKSEVAFEGDMRAFMANLLYYKLVLAAPRALAEAVR